MREYNNVKSEIATFGLLKNNLEQQLTKSHRLSERSRVELEGELRDFKFAAHGAVSWSKSAVFHYEQRDDKPINLGLKQQKLKSIWDRIGELFFYRNWMIDPEV